MIRAITFVAVILIAGLAVSSTARYFGVPFASALPVAFIASIDTAALISLAKAWPKTPRERKGFCAYCRYQSDYTCDGEPQPGGDPLNCERELCLDHAVTPWNRSDLHYCPEHAATRGLCVRSANLPRG
jgi:hypothetical protein